MKSSPLQILFAIATIVLASCSSAGVVTKSNNTADFESIRTFNFLKPPIDTASGQPMMPYEISRVIEAAIDHELGKKGYDISDNPDIWIAYWGKAEQRSQMVYANVYMPPSYYYGPNTYGYNAGWAAQPVNSYKLGMLRIDMVDATTNELIWYGQGSGVLDPDPVKRNHNINVMTYKIFKRFNHKVN
jgi:hypothetical protein